MPLPLAQSCSGVASIYATLCVSCLLHITVCSERLKSDKTVSFNRLNKTGKWQYSSGCPNKGEVGYVLLRGWLHHGMGWWQRSIQDHLLM